MVLGNIIVTVDCIRSDFHVAPHRWILRYGMRISGYFPINFIEILFVERYCAMIRRDSLSTCQVFQSVDPQIDCQQTKLIPVTRSGAFKVISILLELTNYKLAHVVIDGVFHAFTGCRIYRYTQIEEFSHQSVASQTCGWKLETL